MLILKHIVIFITVFIFFSLIALTQTSASPSCCVDHGGEYACDYSNGTLYCRDGSVSTDCTCRLNSTPTPSHTPIPTITPTPAIPSCVVNSTYNKVTKLCHCNSGFTVHDEKCVSYEQYCWEKFGGNSVFNSDKNACTCSSGNSWNKDATKCISYNEICHVEIGNKSYYDPENNSCNCFSGYSIKDNNCQIIPTKSKEVEEKQVTSKVILSPTKAPEPTIVKKIINTPTPSIDLKKDESKIVKKAGNEDIFISEEKNENEGIITKLVLRLKNFIISIFGS